MTGGTTAWFDVSAGVAGDMVCGALVDAGAPLAALQAAVDAVVPGAVRLHARPATRAGLRATDVTVEVLTTDHAHRSWAVIERLLAGADLPGPVRTPATAVFARLAEAEGRVHGVPPADVEFHEVGALDAIADVVAACAGLDVLGVTRVLAGPMALGSGTVRGAHGRLPVPVPAVLELVRGWQVRGGAGGDADGELATPTGAAIVTALASACTPLPDLTVTGVGVGAGDRDPAGRANVVRVVLGAPAASAEAATAGGLATTASAAVVLEANVDDLDPRVWPEVLARLLAAGAADAWLTPILMKKGRPAHTLAVLAAPADVPALRAVVLRETSSIGLRETAATKHALDRAWVPVAVGGGEVRVKVASAGGRTVHATPEFDDVRALAARTGRPVRDVLEEAVAAAVAAGLVPGSP